MNRCMVVGLSFDDGPDCDEIKLVSALNEAGIRATFFWIPEKVSAFLTSYPENLSDLLHLIFDGGHQIGVHGLVCRRPNLFERIFCPDNCNKILEAQKKFSELIGTVPILYRPHYVRYYRTPRGMKTVIGSFQIFPNDDPKKYLRAVTKAKSGDIICGHSSQDFEFKRGIAPAIGNIVPEMKKILDDRGLKAITVSEVLNCR